MKNHLITNNEAILTCIKANRIIAYSFAQLISTMPIEWAQVMRFDEFKIDGLPLSEIDNALVENIKRRFYRARNFIQHRGLYIDALRPEDFNNCLLLKSQFILLFTDPLDRMTWAHEMVNKLCHRGYAKDKAKPEYQWDMSDKTIDAKYLGEFRGR
jgi:hypothetical protein